jgi:hypothetical protein
MRDGQKQPAISSRNYDPAPWQESHFNMTCRVLSAALTKYPDDVQGEKLPGSGQAGPEPGFHFFANQSSGNILPQ